MPGGEGDKEEAAPAARPAALLRWDEVPEDFVECFILSGYRRLHCSAQECLASVLQPTNETLNFWTHFIPLLLFLSRFGRLLLLRGGRGRALPPPGPAAPLVLCLGGAAHLRHELHGPSLQLPLPAPPRRLLLPGLRLHQLLRLRQHRGLLLLPAAGAEPAGCRRPEPLRAAAAGLAAGLQPAHRGLPSPGAARGPGAGRGLHGCLLPQPRRLLRLPLRCAHLRLRHAAEHGLPHHVGEPHLRPPHAQPHAFRLLLPPLLLAAGGRLLQCQQNPRADPARAVRHRGAQPPALPHLHLPQHLRPGALRGRRAGRVPQGSPSRSHLPGHRGVHAAADGLPGCGGQEVPQCRRPLQAGLTVPADTVPSALGLEMVELVTFTLATLRLAQPCPEDAVNLGERHLWKKVSRENGGGETARTL